MSGTAASLLRMTYVEPTEDLPPVAGATIVYLGPVAPHWEIRHTFGEQKIIDAFRIRVNARLLLLPKHDPQFRRNRERVNRDGERELIRVDWDLGDEEPARAPEAVVEEAPAVEDAPVVEDAVEEAPVVDDAVAEDASVDEAPAVEADGDESAEPTD